MSEIIHYYVEEARKGDEKAFCFIARQYEPLVKCTVRKTIKSFPDLYTDESEVASLVWNGIWLGILAYDFEKQLPVPYCMICSINKIIQKDLRKKMVYKKKIELLSSDENKKIVIEDYEDLHGEGPAEKLLKKEEYRELHRAVEQLPDFYRKLIFLRYRIGFSIKEIAEEYSASRSHIAHSLAYARNILKTSLAGKIS